MDICSFPYSKKSPTQLVFSLQLTVVLLLRKYFVPSFLIPVVLRPLALFIVSVLVYTIKQINYQTVDWFYRDLNALKMGLQKFFVSFEGF